MSRHRIDPAAGWINVARQSRQADHELDKETA